ncbi:MULTISPECIES: hypothetical protein [unclassified Archaeoglobus]|uniref:hypothetical protein n=1 Tax=unclassified Archaeoglobus TaxID=2643606 RepID=UPI0025BDE2E4|nr:MULTISPECIES: hypothetical protein [unclassified Archaeoglobus]
MPVKGWSQISVRNLTRKKLDQIAEDIKGPADERLSYDKVIRFLIEFYFRNKN